MKKNKNIAIVGGGGVTAVMTALACARKGISVDFFLDDLDYDEFKTSLGSHCLWRSVHEDNPRLSRFAAQSQWIWEKFILASSGEFGRKERVVRVVERAELNQLIKLYELYNLPYEVKNCGDDESIVLPPFLDYKNKFVFVSYDSILLNVAEIFSYFSDELAFFTRVNVFRNKNIGGLGRIEDGVIFVDEKKHLYDIVVKFTNDFKLNQIFSFNAVDVEAKTVFKDFYLSDTISHLTQPIWISENEFNIWLTPSVDGRVIRVGMDVHFPQSAEVLARNLNIDAYLSRSKIDVMSSSIFSIGSRGVSSEDAKSVIPCWTVSDDNKKIVVVESVDSYYNASPAVAEEITTLLTLIIN